MRHFALLVALATGCAQSESITCDDGRTCPSATACDETHHLCVLPSQLTACKGKANNEPCSYGAVTDAVCLDGVCIRAGCGNSVVEEGEACDDGNTERGDGCSADCLSDETCGNGVVDAVNGEACDDGNGDNNDACHTTCLQPTCGDGIIDAQYKEVCDAGSANSFGTDAPCRPNCLPARCGDGVLDTGEVCDDSNGASGDGCSFDCLSNETCGNGYVDYADSEQCDDGNDFAQDGCSVCRPERPTWRKAEATIPGDRYGYTMAFDASRGRVVLFGGYAAGTNNSHETWEWDGRAWNNVTPAGGNPPGLFGHAMAYDAKRARVVVFGGEGDTSSPLAQTWEWDGRTWKNVTPATGSPPARRNHAMAYDPIRGKVVMFSGNNSAADTWEWDGTSWTDVTPASGNPPKRFGHAMAFDAKRGRIVMFGGLVEGTTTQLGNDTWEWNGTSWTEVTLASGNPPALQYHSMAYDTTTGQVIVYGGRDGTSNTSDDVWGWDGTTWTDLTPASGNPGTREFHAAAFDTNRGRMVVYGGESADVPFNDTLEWDGTWHVITPTAFATPPERVGEMMAYDAARGRIVMFGGASADYLFDTWEWDGSRWTEVTLGSGNPQPRWIGTLAYDAVRRRVVLFGGEDANGLRDDTWEWDGTTWSDVTPASGNPAGRRYAAMTYDAARGKVVLFGGIDASFTRLADTWVWNGTSWMDVTPVASNPPARARFGMAYDAARAKVVMFGGSSNSSFLNDTWEWNGTAWTLITPGAGSPDARYSHTLTYDPVLRRTVMFGGASAAEFLDETWLWDGAVWSNVTSLTGNPQVRFLHGAASDAAHGGTLVFAGEPTGAGPLLDDTWLFSYSSNQGHETCLYGIDGDNDGKIGCADPECFGVCNPMCPPGTTCNAALPHCGDGTCDGVETKRVCPADCGAPAAVCGDFLCDSSETKVSCPGDCGP